MSGSMTISSWLVSVQVFSMNKVFVRKVRSVSARLTRVNKPSWVGLITLLIGLQIVARPRRFPPEKKQTKNYTRYTLLLEWLPFPFVQMNFICMRMKNHFHIKGWAVNLVVIQRPRRTRKWLIPVKLILCARTETGNRKIVVGQTSRSGISRREETLIAVSILQFQDLWMSGSMTISSWLVSVQVFSMNKVFVRKVRSVSARLTRVNKPSWVGLITLLIGLQIVARPRRFLPEKKNKQKTIHVIHFYWNDFLSHLYFI